MTDLTMDISIAVVCNSKSTNSKISYIPLFH